MDLDNNRKLIAAALAAVGSGDPNALQTVYRLGTMKSRIRRAMIKLKACLEQ